MKKLKCCEKAIAQQRFASMAWLGIYLENTLSNQNLFLYLLWSMSN
jgi:hypothetical protein